VKITVNPLNIKEENLMLPGTSQPVSLTFHDVKVADVLRALSKQAGFNIVIDESVTGSLSINWNSVLVKDALETLRSYANLSYSVQGSTLLVAGATSPSGQSFQKGNMQIIPLKNANASVVANFLNTTVFADRVNSASSASSSSSSAGSAAAGSSASAGSGSGSSGSSGSSSAGGSMPVTADFHTNSLVVIGSPKDIQTVKKHLEVLDQPREMKTWHINHANVLDVANLLSASLFNEGQPPIILGSSSGSSSSGSGSSGSQPASLRVNSENISEGSGVSDTNQNNDQQSLLTSVTLRTRIQQTDSIGISPKGPILLPDTRLNMLTLMGTAEQIAMAEALMPTFDKKVPQVVLEASLLEITDTDRSELGFSNGGNAGYFSSGSNNSLSTTLTNRAFSNTVGRTTSTSTPLENIFRFSTNPLKQSKDFVYQLNTMARKNKIKVLANPTVITTSDNETLISIVDEIIVSTTVVQGSVGAPSFTNNIGEAGIVLNILPKVGADNTIALRIRPVVSTIAGTQQDRFGNLVTLLAKREVLSQNVQLKDGETFFLGGLIQDSNVSSVASNPLFANLPIVGALARNSIHNKRRSELVIMITPHIANEDKETASLSSTMSSGETKELSETRTSTSQNGMPLVPQGREAGEDTTTAPSNFMMQHRNTMQVVPQNRIEPEQTPSGTDTIRSILKTLQ
jgi:general secretion pathway protein D